MHSSNLLRILLLLFPALSHSQTITPAPSIDLRRRQQSPSPTTSSLDYFSALGICLSAAPCTSYPPLHEACKAEYNGDFKYLYCLCTTGYYDSRTACDACSFSSGIGVSGGSAFYASQASWYRSECSDYATRFSANVTTGTGTGIMGAAGLGSGMASVTGVWSAGGGGSASFEDEDEGGAVRTTPMSYPSSPIGVTTRIPSVGSDVPFGGLVSTGSEGFTDVATATATATGSESRGVRTWGVQGGMVLPVAISIMSRAILF